MCVLGLIETDLCTSAQLKSSVSHGHRSKCKNEWSHHVHFMKNWADMFSSRADLHNSFLRGADLYNMGPLFLHFEFSIAATRQTCTTYL